MRYIAFILFNLICLGILPLSAQGPVTIESLRDLSEVSAPKVSPDGESVLFQASKVDWEKNRVHQILTWMDLSTLRRYPLAYNTKDVQWSPDGKYITFRGDYGFNYGLYRSEVIVTNEKTSLSPPIQLAPLRESNHFLGHPTRKNHAWSPDGKYLAIVAADPSTCIERDNPNDPVVIDRTLYKSRRGLSDECLTRIFLVESRGGRPAEILTPGPYDSHSLSWSPDGRYICFVSNHTDSPDDNYKNDLWKVDIQTREITRLTESAGTEHAPQWSPDNRWIAFPATERPLNTKDSPPENTQLYLVAADGDQRLNLTKELDRRASNPQWDIRGEWLYFTAPNEGKHCIYRVKPGTTPEPVICEEGFARSFALTPEKIVYTFEDTQQPSELFMAAPDGMFKQRLTFSADRWTRGKKLARVEEFWFDSFDGTRVQGFVAYQPDLPANAHIPVVHRIHGGPHGMYGFSFSAVNEILTGAGYAVLYINPRGSTGYGQQFADGTHRAWGEGDYKDLTAGVEAALTAFSFLDGNNMAVMGGSYGGYMTNWIVTQTNRYKAAASIASVSNLISFYGTSLYQLLIETEFGGFPWNDYDLLWNYSPLAHVQQVRTPTLLLHGEDDQDVPISQAEEFYIALRKLGIPTRLVRYPNEGHGFEQPAHREHYLHQILEWFGRYLPAQP